MIGVCFNGNWRPQVAPTETLRKILIRPHQTEKELIQDLIKPCFSKSHISVSSERKSKRPYSRQQACECPELPRLGGLFRAQMRSSYSRQRVYECPEPSRPPEDKSIRNAPRGAVMIMDRTATVSIISPHGSPIARGIPPMAACTVAFGV